MSELSQINENLAYIRGKVDVIAEHGCALAPGHLSVEVRLRAMEMTMSKASGAMVVMVALAGIIGAVTNWLISWFSSGKDVS